MERHHDIRTDFARETAIATLILVGTAAALLGLTLLMRTVH